MTKDGPDNDKLVSVLKRVLRDYEGAPKCPIGHLPDTDTPTQMLVYSFLLWESSPTRASEAIARLGESVIDCNELRVAMPSEIAEIAGIRDGVALERAERLRASLNDVFRREHAVSIGRLAEVSKREAREFLDGLEGMCPFVAARVTLIGLGGHAMPVDARLVSMLAKEDVLASSTSLEDAERWLERQIRAGEAEEAVLALESWRDEVSVRRAGTASRRAAKPAKKGE